LTEGTNVSRLAAEPPAVALMDKGMADGCALSSFMANLVKYQI